MPLLGGGKRRLMLLVAVLGSFFVIANLLEFSGENIRSQIDSIPLPGRPKKTSLDDELQSGGPADAHPISKLMEEADQKWWDYEGDRSLTFKETVSKYRRKYGRHPPPGFQDWYKLARDKNVYNVDDFEQIMDDLRPFWAVEPHVIRTLAAHMWEDESVSGIHIRNHKLSQSNVKDPSWRSETLITLIEKFAKYLPDMDIAMNRLDQPRVVVPWEDMQAMLAKEAESRQMPPEANNEFTPSMPNLLNLTLEKDDSPREDPQWFPAHGKQYMDIARTACPPEAHARENGSTTTEAEALYKDRSGGLITNFNRSSDLCTIGPELQEKHGFLFSSSTVIATKRLVPIFGECKVNVNSDILFPANMYWKHDERYDYDGKYDVDWDKKADVMVWRGVTSGGVQLEDNWQKMHRQRLVMLVNGTEMEGKEVRILTEQPEEKGEYENLRQFKPSKFASNHTDVGFVEAWGCIPDCNFYNNVWTFKPQTTLSEQFKYKYVVDVDGHSFSGRWRAFLESKSLGIKATIFREWHDSRLFAWRHFVPMDNRFDDVYSLLTYFIGVGSPEEPHLPGAAFVARHDREARRLALQGREWANKVLRRDDIEIYMFRLLLEYARIIDDNRDRIGYSGDGSELDKYDSNRDGYF
ncbi:hypothetical protein MMC20_006424 [Loxospora ochrophaea]|nr:hypothetical protein [Loxospora ochrophaea]